MPGYDDPRFLRQTIEGLEARLKKLEGSALKLAANQQGAIPGAMRAVTIGDPGLGSAMWLNLSGNQPGQAPYQAVTDANKVVRVEIGNLATNGNSPAQLGLRANDSNGVPLFDSLGLIGVMKQPTPSLHPTTFWTTTSTTPVLITGTAITFNVVRQTTYLFFGDVACNVTGAAPGNWGYVRIYLDGVNQGPTSSVPYFSLGGQVTNASLVATVSLAAGSHTMDLRGNVDNASVTLQFFAGDVFIFQLGG